MLTSTGLLLDILIIKSCCRIPGIAARFCGSVLSVDDGAVGELFFLFVA